MISCGRYSQMFMALLEESAVLNKVYRTTSNTQSLQNVFTYKSGSAELLPTRWSSTEVVDLNYQVLATITEFLFKHLPSSFI